MPDSPKAENKPINFRLNRILKRKLDKLAAIRCTSATTLLTQWIIEGTQNVELTAEEYEEIAAEVREARKNKKRG